MKSISTALKSLLFLGLISVFSLQAQRNKLQMIAIEHATFVIKTGNLTILVDPGRMDIEKYSAFHNPDLILITHQHGDHFDLDIINKLKGDKTELIGPEKIVEKTGFGKIVRNYENIQYGKIRIEAIPMYNTSPDRLKYHKKGEGNGYVLNIEGQRIYISGDTEDIPEMRKLKNIDQAFVCMNLPYTMTPEQAASAVLEFKPKNVYPYHYRTQNISNDAILERFAKIVEVNKKIKISYLKWYDEL